MTRFLALFGPTFSNHVQTEIKNSEVLHAQMIAFLSLGYERNKMVHENFLEYNLDKTFDEIAGLHQKAAAFVDYLTGKVENLRLFASQYPSGSE